MVLHYLSREGDDFLRAERAVGPYFQNELVVVGVLAYARVFYVVVYLLTGV